MTREEYLIDCKNQKKFLIKKLIDIFFIYDGDYTALSDAIHKSKSVVSTLLNNDKLINEMISDNEITKEEISKIKDKIEENKKRGNKKGGDNFTKKYAIEYNDKHRIVSHTIRRND